MENFFSAMYFAHLALIKMGKNLKLLAGPILAILAAFYFTCRKRTHFMQSCRSACINGILVDYGVCKYICHQSYASYLISTIGNNGYKGCCTSIYERCYFSLYRGFILTFAIERWNLHKRISLNILLEFGNTPGRLLFGFSVSTYFISMWLNNTSTTLMMLPIVLAVVDQIHGGDDKRKQVWLQLYYLPFHLLPLLAERLP